MKEKIKLSGVPETMLQTVYARAKESRGGGIIHDAKAEEIIEKMDYDFPLPTRILLCTVALLPAPLCWIG